MKAERILPRPRAGIGRILPLLLLLNVFSCNRERIDIVDMPIDFTEKRIQLTLDYIESHYGFRPEDITIEPRIIMLHWTESSDFNESYQIFKPEEVQYEGISSMVTGASPLNVSIHFLVDRDGTIYRLMPETFMARHVIGLNYCSIGVENVGGEGGVDNMTGEQVRANINLVKYLSEKYPSIEYLAGHHEYRMFENSAFWMEKDSSYRTVKTDPGDAFMKKVRQGTNSCHLLAPPIL